MTFIIQNFGPNLARLRIEKGVSQTQLAEDLGIGKQSISDYEKQKSFGRRLVRSKLSRVYTKDAYLLVRARKARLPFFCQRP